MKRFTVLFLILALASVFAGCTSGQRAPGTEAAAETVAPAEETAEQAALPSEITEQTATEAAQTRSADEFMSQLKKAAQSYFPGTAGSSLSAAACAAGFADCFVHWGPSEDEVSAAVKEYCAGAQDAESSRLFAEQISGIVTAFSALCKEDGAALMESCGYTAETFPWNEKELLPLFEAAERTAAGAADTASAEALHTALTELLADIHGSCFPGTAGSSLVYAGRAGALADLFTEYAAAEDAVCSTVNEYRRSLPEDELELFGEQMDGIAGAFAALNGEYGEGLLEDCGYDPVYFPWDADELTGLFRAAASAASAAVN